MTTDARSVLITYCSTSDSVYLPFYVGKERHGIREELTVALNLEVEGVLKGEALHLSRVFKLGGIMQLRAQKRLISPPANQPKASSLHLNGGGGSGRASKDNDW